MWGNVWASPLGDVLITRGGDVFTVGDTRPTDMIYYHTLTQNVVNGLQWDTERSEIVTLEGAVVRRYRLNTYALFDSRSLEGSGSFIGKRGATIYAVRVGGDATLVDVIDVNQAPSAIAHVVSPTVECTSQLGATAQLDGSASTDPDDVPGIYDDIASYEWFKDFGQPGEMLLGEGELLDATLPLGAHLLTLRVTDNSGQMSIDETLVTIVDTVSPEISVELTPVTLWPPNHEMVDVEAMVLSADTCGPPSVVLASVLSNEADNGHGDGNTVNDIQDAVVGTADYQFRLRAERAGGGTGRIYTAVYTATDEAGNAVSEAGAVVVPHDQDGEVEPIDLAVEQSDAGSVVSWGAVSGLATYDVIRGNLSAIAETSAVFNLGTVTCLEDNSADSSTVGHEDSATPPPGEGFFYLVKYFDGTTGSYGTESASKPRAPGAGDCD
jgi:hypothetical protein